MKTISNAIIAAAILCAADTAAADFRWYCTTEGQPMKERTIRSRSGKPNVTLEQARDYPAFKSWGATFNELDWDALNLLPEADRNELLDRFFAPDGDLRLGLGRVSMGANDYARSWYCCDSVAGDLELRHFNIDRDRQAIIPFIREAQRRNPRMRFWVSPWSPIHWMKINGDYPVLSSKYNNQPKELDYLLYSGIGGETDENEMKLDGDRKGVFPRQLATTDYMIQDPRYLKAYAESFCRFIDEYAKEGIPVEMVMYQNEAYSYTPYPGCAWTAPSIIRFNRDYLAPALKARHPEVRLFLGTFNTNRLEHVRSLLADEGLLASISGMGFQWEGREVLPVIAREHPGLEFISSESECGWGSFDYAAGEHTFELINHYLANRCSDYNFWNIVLTSDGVSPWGWKQNALVAVDAEKGTYTLTPEFYAASHYARFMPEGTRVTAYRLAPKGGTKEAAGADASELMPVLQAVLPDGRQVTVAGNLSDKPLKAALPASGGSISVTLPAHSFNTFVEE